MSTVVLRDAGVFSGKACWDHPIFFSSMGDVVAEGIFLVIGPACGGLHGGDVTGVGCVGAQAVAVEPGSGEGALVDLQRLLRPGCWSACNSAGSGSPRYRCRDIVWGAGGHRASRAGFGGWVCTGVRLLAVVLMGQCSRGSFRWGAWQHLPPGGPVHITLGVLH